MPATLKVLSNNNIGTTIKIVGAAGGDAYTIPLKTTLSLTATGNLTFDASDKTIVRTTGSWATDNVVVGTTLTVTGTTNNNGSFVVAGVDGATITVDSRQRLVDEVAAAATVAAYTSPLAAYGQIISGTQRVNIGRVNWSVASTATVVRNSVTVYQLAGSHEFNAGYGDDQQNDQSIVVTTVGGVGTVILELKKVDGYVPLNPPGIL